MPTDNSVRALERANNALSRIDSHEVLCAERYAQIAAVQQAIHKKLDDFRTTNFRQWLVVAGGIITILLSISGLLFTKIMGWI